MTFPLAQSGLTFLIYLAVGVFWLVGNLLQQKRAKAKALEMRREREKREAEEKRTGRKITPQKKSVESELEAFLGRLSGEPAPPPPPPRQQRKLQKKDDIQFDSTPPPVTTKAATSGKSAASPKIARESSIGEMDLEGSFKQISEMKEAAEISEEQLQQDALASVRAMMIDLSSSSVSVPKIPLQTIRAVNTKSPRPDLQNRRNFKKALVGTIILQPPKALQAEPFTETP